MNLGIFNEPIKQEDFKSNKGVAQKFVRPRKRKANPATDNPLEVAREKLDVGAIGREANRARLEGRAPSLTQTRQETQGTVEQFMAVWDRDHPGYGSPTGGFGKAKDDPVRKAVRDKAESLVDPNTGTIPPGYADGLKRKLQKAKTEGRILGPDDIGNDPNDSLGDDVSIGVADTAKTMAELPGAIGAEAVSGPFREGLGEDHPVTKFTEQVGGIAPYLTPLGGPLMVGQAAESLAEGGPEQMVKSFVPVDQVKTLLDTTQNPGTRAGAAANLILLALGAKHALRSGAKVLGEVGDHVRAVSEKFGPEVGKAVQTEIESPTFDREAFTKQLQSQEGPLEVGKGALSEQTPIAEPAIPETAPKVEQPKEPWQMTGDEYGHVRASQSFGARESYYIHGPAKAERISALGADKGFSSPEAALKELRKMHKGAVTKALAEGNPVPQEVLADYPDLVKASTTAEPATVETPPVTQPQAIQTETPKSTLRIGRRSRAVQPKEEARPAQPESTGLANQVNEREALGGVLNSLPEGRGTTPEHWQREGKKAIEDDPSIDPERLAKSIAEGKEEPSALKFGILLEGKTRLLRDVDNAKRALDEKPGDSKARAKLEAAQERLDTFVEDVQTGKGKWHDMGQALQAGTKLDTGSFADVIQAARRTGHSNEKIEAELSKQADEIAGLKEEVERLRSNPREHDAKQAVASVRSRRYDRTSLESNIKANREKLSQLRGSGGVGAGKKRGAASVITAEDLKVAGEQIVILKDIALDYARLHVGAPLEDVVSGVKKMLKEDGFDVEDQAIVDALAHTQSRPKSEAAKRLEALRNDAKAGSSSAKAKRLLDEQNALVESEASKAKQEFKEGERKKLRIAKKQLDYNERTDLADAIEKHRSDEKAKQNATRAEQQAWEKAERTKSRQDYKAWWDLQQKQRQFNEASDLKAAKQAIADAEKAEWKTVKEAQEAWEKGERLQDGEAKDAYRQWWRTQASILEAQEAIRTGQDIPSRPKESNLTPEQETLKGLRQMAGLKAKLGEAEGQLKTGIRVARVKKPRTVTEEIAELEAQISLKDKRVKQRLTEMEENPTVRRTRKLFKGIQSLKLGSDVGTLRRQGQFFIKHPKIALESVSEAWQAAKSDLAMSKWQDKWDNGKYSDGRSVARVEKESGLLTPDVVTGHEEMVALRWLRELGGEKLSEKTGALERFQKVYINHARKAYFRMNVEAGLNAEALKDVARYTNNVSGRGNLKETGSALSKLAEVVLTSKNYEASRWGTIAEPVRNVGRLLQRNKGHEPGWKEGAKSNLKDLAKQTAVMGGAVYLASQMGYKPDKGDWSKLRRYKRDDKGEFTIPTDEVHDWTAGLGPRGRDTIQLMAAAVNPTYRQNIGTELNQILKRTFSAGITTPLAIGSSANQRRLGVKEPINPLTGFKMDEYEDTWKALLPLIAASTMQAEADIGAKAGTFIDEFTGGGVNFYPMTRAEKKTSLKPPDLSKTTPKLTFPKSPD